MDFGQNIYIVLCGFLVWLLIAPRLSESSGNDWFLAYMAALLFSLIASSEIMMVKPVAFFSRWAAFCLRLSWHGPW
jgi:hypothetical protein